jgi:hypothetical protein
MLAARDRSPHEAGAFEHANVLGNRIERDREFGGDVCDSRVRISQPREDRAPRRVAERIEYVVEPR